jgi:hypothetical protein
MRNILIVLLLILVSCTRKTVQEPRINQVNISALSFYREGNGSSIPLAATEGNITLAFGSPDSIRGTLAESKSDPIIKWIYNGAVIYLQSGRMVNINLESASFGLEFKGASVKVGENISKLKSIFPESFSVKSLNQLMVGLHHNGELIKSHILVAFNNSGKITRICLME